MPHVADGYVKESTTLDTLNVLEATPRSLSFVAFNGRLWHMKCCIVDVGTIKSGGICIWNRFCIATNIRELGTVLEHTKHDAGHRVANDDARKVATVRERIIPNACHRVGDGDARQAATASESAIPDTGHRIGDGDTRQTATITEHINSNAGHRVGDSDVCQATTSPERRTSNAGHRVGDCDARQAATILVFATCCVSEIFD